MRPTRPFLLLSAAGFVLAALPLWSAEGLWTLWLAFVVSLVLLLGADWILTVRGRALKITIAVDEMIPIGRTVPLTVTIDTDRRSLADLEILVDLSENLSEQPPLKATPGDDGYRAQFQLHPLRRGVAVIEAVWTRHRGPLGLIQSHHRHPIDHSIDVTPDVVAVRTLAFRFDSDRALRVGLQVEQFKGEGTEFDSLKEFVTGDDKRAIDWKASARHAKLLCRQFRAECNHQVMIAVDSGRLMNETLGGVSRLDHGINCALLLSYVGLRTGDRVGFFSFGARPGAFLAPRGGMATQLTIQRASASVEYSRAETNYTLGLTTLAHRIRRRSLIVFLTDFSDTITAELMIENLNRLARRHLVIFVTLRDRSLDVAATRYPENSLGLHRAIVAQRVEEERTIVLSRLRRMGLLTLEAQPTQVGPQLINRYLDVRRRERI